MRPVHTHVNIFKHRKEEQMMQVRNRSKAINNKFTLSIPMEYLILSLQKVLGPEK